MKTLKKNEIKFAVCINDSEPDLELRKVYRILPDEAAAKDEHLRIIDESGEDYLYPASFFVFVEDRLCRSFVGSQDQTSQVH